MDKPTKNNTMETTINLSVTVRYSDNKGDLEFIEKQSGNIIKGYIEQEVNKKVKDIYGFHIDNIKVL